MNVSHRATAILCLAGLWSGSVGASRIPSIPLEGSVESTADQISLPGSEDGILTVRACPECAARTFYFDVNRDLFAAGRRVSLAEMKHALALAGKVPVTVHYRVSDSAVTRIILVVP